MIAREGTWRGSDSPRNVWRETESLAFLASLALVLAIGGFLVVRRFAGAFDASLAPLPLAATAAALILWAYAIRLRLRFAPCNWAAIAALALFAVACSYPGARWVDRGVWAGAFAAYWFLPARRSSTSIEYENPIKDSNGEDGVMLQQVSRSRTADGREIVHGTLVAEFGPGERSTMLHAAFCPPFEQMPYVDAEAIDGEPCDVKIEQVLHQGARFEVRLSRASTAPQRVTVEFAATSEPPLAG